MNVRGRHDVHIANDASRTLCGISHAWSTTDTPVTCPQCLYLARKIARQHR